jgi:putative hydrolase of the HAD superfamily
MYDAVLLDLYDTVAWSEWHAWQRSLAAALGVTFEEVGRAFDVTRPARSIGANPDATADLAAVIEETGVQVTPARLAEIRAMEIAEIEQSLHLYEDSLPVVRELRARGTKTVLVSNCSHNTKPGVERLGLAREFDVVILSYEVRVRKPQPEIYRLALERASVPAERAVFVDDQSGYCDGAAEVGLDTYLILRPNQAAEGNPTNTNGHREIADLTALL